MGNHSTGDPGSSTNRKQRGKYKIKGERENYKLNRQKRHFNPMHIGLEQDSNKPTVRKKYIYI